MRVSMTAAIVFHGKCAMYTRFSLVKKSSDNFDNFINSLLPLAAIWTIPGHDVVRLHCYIIGGQVSIHVRVPQVCCLWALHSQGVASTHSFA